MVHGDVGGGQAAARRVTLPLVNASNISKSGSRQRSSQDLAACVGRAARYGSQSLRCSGFGRWPSLALGLFFCLSLVTARVATLRAGDDVANFGALVRVEIKRKVPAVVYQNRLVPEAAVLEISEFPGIIADPRGYVISYIGSAWADLGGTKPQVSIQLPDGEESPAEFVGIDERVSLAILRAQGLAKRSVVFGSLDGAKSLNLVTWSGGVAGGGHAATVSVSPQTGTRLKSTGSWNVSSFDVLRLSNSDFAPEKQIRVRLKQNLDRKSEVVGAPLLDASGRFFGFVIGSEKVGLVESARLLRVLSAGPTRKALSDVVAKGGSVRAGWLGVWLDDATGRGRIQKVIEDSPAARAGLQDGDLILKLGDSTVWSKSKLVRMLRWESPGTTVPMTVERNGQRKDISVVLGSWPVSTGPRFAWAIQLPKLWASGPAADTQTMNLRMYPVPVDAPVKLGLAVEPLTAQLARYFRVPGRTGLLVTSVVDGSPASRFQFRAGDVLVQINGSGVESATDIRKVIDTSKDGILSIEFVRDGELRTCRVVLQ